MSKTLTISIAGYNVEKYIRETLDSLCLGTIIEDIEVFVVDDGGKDNSYEIAKEYEEKYPNSIHAVHKENGGWGSTVNYSIHHATGKYFRLLDGDDYFKSENLESYILELKKTEADLVYTPYRRFDDSTGKTVDTFDADPTLPRNRVIELSNCTKVNFVMHAIAFKTEILQKNSVTILEHCFYTDAEYRTKGLAFCNSVVFLEDEIYQYRVGREGQSIDINGLKKHYKESQQVVAELVDFSKKHSDIKNADQVKKYTKGSIIFQYNALIALGNKEELKSFDKRVQGYGYDYYNLNDKTIRILRVSHFGVLGLVRIYRSIRSRLGQIVKLYIKR